MKSKKWEKMEVEQKCTIFHRLYTTKHVINEACNQSTPECALE